MEDAPLFETKKVEDARTCLRDEKSSRRRGLGFCPSTPYASSIVSRNLPRMEEKPHLETPDHASVATYGSGVSRVIRGVMR